MNRAAPRRLVSRPSGPPPEGPDAGEVGEEMRGVDGEGGSPPEERRGEVDAMAGANQPNPSTFFTSSSSPSRYLRFWQ